MKVLQTASRAGFLAALLCAGFAAQAQETATKPAGDAESINAQSIVVDAADTTLEDWLWLKRPVVVFADSPADPRFVKQVTLLTDRLNALEDRDVVVITDTDPRARSTVREALRPRGFMLVIIAKDGSIVARKPAPWDVREISRSIDKLPLREQEVRDKDGVLDR